MKLKLTLDGQVYEVDVEVASPEDPQPSFIPAAGGAPSQSKVEKTKRGGASDVEEAVDDESKVCRSPISGVIVRIISQAGQDISSNEVIMVLEAMKMETEITSPIDGKIKSIRGDVGDPVKSGQVLVEFE